jgi:hypothetical protein
VIQAIVLSLLHDHQGWSEGNLSTPSICLHALLNEDFFFLPLARLPATLTIKFLQVSRDSQSEIYYVYNVSYDLVTQIIMRYTSCSDVQI